MLRGKCFGYLVIFALAIVAPFLLRGIFQRDLLVLSGIFAILALSLDIIMGGMGQYSFGHAAFFGIGAYTSALLSLKLGGASAWLGFLLAPVLAGAVGSIIGFVCLRTLRGIPLAIVTVGFAVVFLLIANNWWTVTGGPRGLLRIPHPSIAVPFLPEIVLRSDISHYYLVLAFLLLTMYLISRLRHSRFGRALASLRENEDLARSIGVSPIRYYTLGFTLATALAGLSGSLYAHHLTVVNPLLFSLYYMFIMLVMVIVGGSGTLGGPVLGAVIFVWVPPLMPVAKEYRLLIFGAILFAFVLFMPRGVYPGLISLWDRFTNFVRKQ